MHIGIPSPSLYGFLLVQRLNHVSHIWIYFALDPFTTQQKSHKSSQFMIFLDEITIFDGLPMFFLRFSYGFLMVFLCFPSNFHVFAVRRPLRTPPGAPVASVAGANARPA